MNYQSLDEVHQRILLAHLNALSISLEILETVAHVDRRSFMMGIAQETKDFVKSMSQEEIHAILAKVDQFVDENEVTDILLDFSVASQANNN